jgi:4'-phosphopantetheinyl transferase EntD
MGARDDEAEIVLGFLALSEAPAGAGGAWLGGDERSRLNAMSGPIRPREFLGGRFLLRSMAARLLRAEPGEIEVEVEEKGRPRVVAPDRLFVGLTHTRDYAACALSRSRIGLDLEELGRAGDLEGVEDLAFHPEERASLEGPDRERRFFSIWTLKEAYLKHLGFGVPDIEQAPSFTLGPGTDLSASGGRNCGYACFELGGRLIGALAFDLPEAAPGGRVPRVAIDPRFGPPPGLEPRALYGAAIFGG